MSKHTAGPWHIVTSTRGKNWVTIQGEQGRFVVKPDVRNTYGEDGELLVDSGVWMTPENARLIASAPDLLAALERIGAVEEHHDDKGRFTTCSRCGATVEGGSLEPCSPDDCDGALARSAIAKARGTR